MTWPGEGSVADVSRRRARMRGEVAVVGAALVLVVACTRGGGVEIVTPATPVPTSAVLSFVIAAEVADDGTPVDPTAIVDPNARQVVAVVRLGAVDPGELVLSWHHLDGDDPSAPLFEHRLEVTSGDTAYSTGISPGSLALGLYEVRAAFAKIVQTARWMVSERRTASGGAEAVLLDDAQGAEAGLPQPGPSGTIAGSPSSTGTAAGSGSGTADGCVLTAAPHGPVSVYVEATGCAGDHTTVAAGPVGGPFTAIGGMSNDFLRPWGVDPCDVGASDDPGTELGFVARIDSGPHAGVLARATTRLPPDTEGPGLEVEADPPPRTLVFPGDPILLSISATEAGMAQIGLAEITVRDERGNELHHQRVATEPAACDERDDTERIAVVVDVPEDAGDVFWVDVGASDLTGNASLVSLAWPTKATFTGLLVGRARLTVEGDAGGTNDCHATWHVVTSVVVQGRGEVEGTATAEPLRGPRCTYGVGGVGYSEYAEMRVDGTFDGERLSIRFLPTVIFGFDSGLHLLWNPAPRTLVLPVEGSSASTSFSYTRPGAGSLTTFEGDLTLQCQECFTAGASP